MAAMGVLLPFAADAQETISTIQSIRFWSLNSATRIAVETSREVKWRAEKIDKPDRLFIDIFDTRMGLKEKGTHVVKVGDSRVKQIRMAQSNPKTTRIVLDLEGSAEHEITQLTNPFRLMVEVRSPGARSEAPVVTESRPSPVRPEPAKPEPAKVETARAEPPAPVLAETRADPPKPAVDEPKIDPPRAARTDSRGQRSLTRALGLKLAKIVIDPGHGAHDHGTTGPTGLAEKELVLDVAQRLGDLIEQRMGSEVVYTRSDDTFIPLEQRTAIANRERADLFLSIHANSSPVRKISGAEVYYLNFTSSKVDMEVAARENAGTTMSIHELGDLVRKIALKEKIDESREFAAALQGSLHSTWSKMNSSARNRGVKKAPFVVLIGAAMPSVLAEIGFISNSRDESMLKKPDQRQRIAESLYRGIEKYAGSLSQLRMAQRSGEPTAATR
jgi:N-acetylmuramoyl-L-alanine amidase